jgi:carbonic anhydrase
MKKGIQIGALYLLVLMHTSCDDRQKNPEQISPVLNANLEYAHAVIHTPEDALTELKNGNTRFLEDKMINTNYKDEIVATMTDQHPHSLILSCLDSRIPPEIIFDQGIGNLFVARVAGNIEDQNVLGSMEFATKVKGTKLIVVMGHNKCGAVKGAIDNAVLGNLTQLVDQIKPAITGDKSNMEAMITETAQKNVQLTITDILNQSPIIDELVKSGSVKIVGAFYDITSGKVHFLEQKS